MSGDVGQKAAGSFCKIGKMRPLAYNFIGIFVNLELKNFDFNEASKTIPTQE